MPTHPTAPRLRRRSPASFWTSDTLGLAHWLEAQGWQSTPGRSLTEAGRYVNASALLILYHSGAVTVAGAAPEWTIELLQPLIVEDEAQQTRGWL